MDYDDTEGKDADEMDWTPTDPVAASAKYNVKRNVLAENDDGSWLRPQRFFPPEKPTGLEGLFARTLLMDDTENHSTQDKTKEHRKLGLSFLSKWWVLSLSFIPLLAIVYKFWWRWDVTFTRTDSTTFTRDVDYDDTM